MQTSLKPARQRRRRMRRRIRWGRFACFLLVAYLALTFGRVEWRIFQANNRVLDLERQIRTEQERAAVMDAEIAYRQTDAYIEMVARRELGLVKPGEVPVLYTTNR